MKIEMNSKFNFLQSIGGIIFEWFYNQTSTPLSLTVTVSGVELCFNIIC